MSLFLPIIEALNRHNVTYVIVGGLAVVLHGHSRLTADVDIVLALDNENTSRAIQALTSIGLRARAPVDPALFADPEVRRRWIDEKGMTVFSMVDPAKPYVTADLFLASPLPFSELYARSELVEAFGTSVRICSLEDLIAMKDSVGRAQDKEDANALRKIRDARTG